jgi:hypothetical protein
MAKKICWPTLSFHPSSVTAEWRAGLLWTAYGVGIRWPAAAGAWCAVRDMDATWEKNSGT